MTEYLSIASGWQPWAEPYVLPSEINSFTSLLHGNSQPQYALSYIVETGTAYLLQAAKEADGKTEAPAVLTLCLGPYSIPPALEPEYVLENTTNRIAKGLHRYGLTVPLPARPAVACPTRRSPGQASIKYSHPLNLSAAQQCTNGSSAAAAPVMRMARLVSGLWRWAYTE